MFKDESFTGAPRGCDPDGEQPDHRQAVPDGGAEERQQPRTRTGGQSNLFLQCRNKIEIKIL
jgi:hypothetical protein